MENDDGDATGVRSAAGQRIRAKAVKVQLTPPPPLTPPAAKSTPTAPTRRTLVDHEDMTDSFLDLGRMSFETTRTASSVDDPTADGVSLDQETSPEYLHWGR